MKRTDPLITAAEAAEYLNLGVATVYDLSRKGRLPVVTFGAAKRYLLSDLEAFVAANRQSA